MTFLSNLLDLLLEASPWLVFGLALGGMIKALGSGSNLYFRMNIQSKFNLVD